MGFLGDLGLAAVNGGISLLGNQFAQKNARDNLDYQMDRYYSPLAQVRNLAAAGINPAVAFGNQSPVFSGGGQFQVPSNPLSGIGTTSLTDLANYMNAKANVKKSGAETRKTDLEADAISFENELNTIFKQPERVANLMSAYKALQLQDDDHNINQWKVAQEKALSELTGVQKDTATKIFNNMDMQLQQENKQREEGIKLTQEKQKTEKSAQSSNYASANASNTQADVNRENRRLQAALADVEETTSVYKAKSLISEYKSKGMISDADWQEARNRLDNLEDVAHRKKGSIFFNEVDAFSDWLKSKIKIFK